MKYVQVLNHYIYMITKKVERDVQLSDFLGYFSNCMEYLELYILFYLMLKIYTRHCHLIQ